jgi:hypothetical protein
MSEFAILHDLRAYSFLNWIIHILWSLDLVRAYFKPCSNFFKKVPTIFQNQSIFHQKAWIVLGIFFLDDVQDKKQQGCLMYLFVANCSEFWGKTSWIFWQAWGVEAKISNAHNQQSALAWLKGVEATYLLLQSALIRLKVWS